MEEKGMTQPATQTTPQESGCCGGPPKTNQEACCVRDEHAKAAGREGCGCSDTPSDTPAAKKGCC